jgi:hypothetical protein
MERAAKFRHASFPSAGVGGVIAEVVAAQDDNRQQATERQDRRLAWERGVPLVGRAPRSRLS